ncbi:ABC-2 type transport system ATP-binding protein [Mucilaginibacter lappiensis]|uniref:ABC-2 type transport system ATP-binding protein n=1 Tax=Mucilaginibacter lappiensis TaxID=354630 RepID=A0ABR6PGC6_9SPHI|nr:ABC transporter ATP-binding protein [Mucilaginibacter lappiensis]MBB6108711.1 ABC-2 type transport system ATP-binding protein [Mucilaginibacter lappiensis]SIQ26916.1 ABC-2 type transport system ATP-binding protein [Mucilaginibacter lappiensis]
MPDKDELIIETQHLSFSFSKGKAVLEDINLQIPKGAIYGFLGPNGAGKTTTIRLLLNLLKPGGGQIKVFGEPIKDHPIHAFSRIGALIETPSLYEHLTGFDNVWITAGICNIQKSRVLEVLDIVQLSSNAHMHVRNYSLGMKQRLGLALALLSSPDLLILDEPTNGLDPNGIIEIRELLLHLSRDHGVTILVSSHLLSEIEKLVSHIGILNLGKMLFQGSVKQLQEIRQGKSVIEIDTDQNSVAMKILTDHQQEVKQGAVLIEVKYRDKYQLAEIAGLLAKAGLAIYRIQLIESSLEETFLSFINN